MCDDPKGVADQIRTWHWDHVARRKEQTR
jgi:hypothetical protein